MLRGSAAINVARRCRMCRAPKYLWRKSNILFIQNPDHQEKNEKVFLFEFNAVLFQNFKIFFPEWLFLVMFFLG